MRQCKWISLMAMLMFLSACGSGTGNGNQGVRLEDRMNKDSIHNSAPPNGSPDTPPSAVSASPNGQSVGTSPMLF